MTKFGINISKKSKDAKILTPNDSSFSSLYPSLSIKERFKGNIDYKYNGPLVYNEWEEIWEEPATLWEWWITNVIPHNFGYIPQVMAWVNTREGYYINVPNQFRSIGDEITYYENFKCEVDKENIYIMASCIGSSYDGDKARPHLYTFDIIAFMEEIPQ